MSVRQTAQDEAIQALMKEILVTLREKLLQPFVQEINQLAHAIGELQEQQTAFYRETRELINQLENRVTETPLVTLTALRNAIQQAKEG
jgi:DnaJ-domain-containing protein 1